MIQTEVRFKAKEENEGDKEKESVKASNQVSNSNGKSEVGKRQCQLHEFDVEILPQERNTNIRVEVVKASLDLTGKYILVSDGKT